MTHLFVLRRFCKISQRDLAAKVGVSQNTISSLELGQFQPRLTTALAIVNALYEIYPNFDKFEVLSILFEEVKRHD